MLRARGLTVSIKTLREALSRGVIPGTREKWHWTLTAEDVDAAERYFRELAARGAWKGGAAGLERAKGRSR